MLKYNIFSHCLAALLCIYISFYTLSTLNSQNWQKSYEVSQEKFTQLNIRLKKEKQLNTRMNPRDIQQFFDSIKEINNDFMLREKTKTLFMEKTKDFIEIMQTKTLVSIPMTDYINSNQKDNPDTLKNYITEYIEASPVTIYDISVKGILTVCITILIFACIFSTLFYVILTIMFNKKIYNIVFMIANVLLNCLVLSIVIFMHEL